MYLLHFGDFEATRYKLLKHTKWIVLLCSCLHLLDICLAIALKRVLCVICVVEVQIWVVSTNAFSICSDSVDEICAGAFEERILLGALPGDVRLVDYVYLSV